MMMDINESTYVYVMRYFLFWEGGEGELLVKWLETYEERFLRSKTRGNVYAKGSVTNELCSQVLYSVGPPVPF